MRAIPSVTFIILLSCHSHECLASNGVGITQDAFKDCNFQFINTPHVIRTATTNNGLRVHEDYACSFDLSKKGFFTMGDMDAPLMMVRDYGSLISQAMNYSGFKHKSGKDWSFVGNSFSPGKLIKYQKLSLKVIDNDEDTTLVGRQIEHRTDQTGAPMTFEGVHILRISPSYAISIDMPFDQDTPLATRDEVVKELIQLVNSVHSAPEASATPTPTAHQ